jgi:SRSO17 transposase
VVPFSATLAEAHFDAWLLIHKTVLPKRWRACVGVAPQHASAPGKSANCPTLVSQVLASCDVPVMIGLKLFLPGSWTSDAAAMDRVHGPEDARACRAKPEIALARIDRVRAAGVRLDGVLATTGVPTRP